MDGCQARLDRERHAINRPCYSEVIGRVMRNSIHGFYDTWDPRAEKCGAKEGILWAEVATSNYKRSTIMWAAQNSYEERAPNWLYRDTHTHAYIQLKPSPETKRERFNFEIASCWQFKDQETTTDSTFEVWVFTVTYFARTSMPPSLLFS